jgi:hypothetical protein
MKVSRMFRKFVRRRNGVSTGTVVANNALGVVTINEEKPAMDYRQFLCEERDRKLALIRLLISGSVSIVAKSGDGESDVSTYIIQENRDQIAQIEAVLADEGAPIGR